MPSFRHVLTSTSPTFLYTLGALLSARCSSPCSCSRVLSTSGMLAKSIYQFHTQKIHFTPAVRRDLSTHTLSRQHILLYLHT